MSDDTVLLRHTSGDIPDIEANPRQARVLAKSGWAPAPKSEPKATSAKGRKTANTAGTTTAATAADTQED